MMSKPEKMPFQGQNLVENFYFEYLPKVQVLKLCKQ